MEKKILVAVDGSRAALAALDYVAIMGAAIIPDLRVTLFHVEEAVPGSLRREMLGSPDSERRLQEMEERLHQRTAKVLAGAKARLLEFGLEESMVTTDARPRGGGLAKDIVQAAEQGGFDAVVLGRRGLARVQEMFLGSVTNKVVQHAGHLPVWVVGGTVRSCRILCAVDASEGSFRAVDHLGFMLSGNHDCRVTLFHVRPDLQAMKALGLDSRHAGPLSQEIMQDDLQRMALFFDEARRMLAQAGLEPDQVDMISRESGLGVARTILDEIARGGYGTVVMGRRGEGKAFWLGHVSDRVLQFCKENAVWVVG